mmetsp:Transcript_7151/g.11309  ORF Transcript_7151/g.11309 Transcript_7151/m.11309 type:complete len:340 (-) Transcript_7151:636-1655(-)
MMSIIPTTTSTTQNSAAVGEKELKQVGAYYSCALIRLCYLPSTFNNQPVRNQYERLNTSEDDLGHGNQEEDPGCCTCLICCFGCLSLCGCRDWVCRKLVFFPPHCQYMVQVEIKEKGLSSVMKQHVMYIRDETGRFSDPHGGAHFKVYMVPTKRRQKICTIFIRNPDAKSTFLISHGNATDLGLLRNHLLELSMVLDVNVYAYDYTGYGLSTNSGRPTVRDCLADIEAAFQHLTNVIGIKEKDVILYGQSLGTGPTLHLARKHPAVRAVVLHSGIMSGLRVIRPFLKDSYWFDIFPNVDIIRECKSPIFVIHGMQDEEIDILHGRQLYAKSAQKIAPWY